mmetsp:Transcript_16109/g.24714  ORF Transcript_16109/g.24714 Transcript_16109/m.24714 type:complete len:174 (-) Transcript_16109:66-587(-)
MADTNNDENKEAAPIPVTDLPIQSLRNLQQQVTDQYEYISRNLATLKMARNRFNGSKVILDSYTPSNDGKETLIPLTDSLYVPGYLHTDKVLVDLGVGYFADRNPKQAQEYFVRKVKFVQSKIDQLSQKMNETENSKEQIENLLRQKINAEIQRQQNDKQTADSHENNAFLAK